MSDQYNCSQEQKDVQRTRRGERPGVLEELLRLESLRDDAEVERASLSSSTGLSDVVDVFDDIRQELGRRAILSELEGKRKDRDGLVCER